MQLTASNQNLGPINSAQLVGVFKAIAPRSFEKTFDGVATAQINTAMKICIDGLTHDQVNFGLSQVRDNGFCPDPAMFRKWCLGITGFGTEQQRLQDSFKGKHAALANIIKWAGDNNHTITNAEKESYDRCYEMFTAIDWAKNVDRASYLAYEAFKDNYVDVVKEYAENGLNQAIWIKPKVIEKKIVADYGDWGGEAPTEAKEPLRGDELKKYLEEAKMKIKGFKGQGLGGGV